jgi:hypothetical protein
MISSVLFKPLSIKTPQCGVIVLQTSMLLSQRQKISGLEEVMRLPLVRADEVIE